MPIVQSRVKQGVLTFGTDPDDHDFSCQPTNIRLTPTTNTEDPLETLCGDTAAGTGSTTWALTGTAIQDFDDPEGFLMHSFDHNGEVVPFTWQPNATSGVWSGSATIQALEIGGDVNARITTDFSFPLSAAPTYTPPTPLTTGETDMSDQPNQPEPQPTEPEPDPEPTEPYSGG
jgi:hypothetical protein